MARTGSKKHQAKQPKQTPPTPLAPPPARILRPEVQEVIDRVNRGGREYWFAQAERVLRDSAVLANEPEFSDLMLDSKKAVKVSQQGYAKYQKRLEAAKHKGQAAYEQCQDDMMLEVISALTPPPFRKEVNKRLQALLERLMSGADLEKLENVILLQFLLSGKKIPWGLCGLILAIHDRSMAPELEKIENEQKMLDAFTQVMEEMGEEMPDMEDLLASPEKFAEVEQKVMQQFPELFDDFEYFTDSEVKLMEDFEEQVSTGQIALDLFTEEELIAPFHRVEQESGRTIEQFATGEERKKFFIETATQGVEDLMMNSERFQRLCEDIQATVEAWEKAGNAWAHALELELMELDGDFYEQSAFVLQTFTGQMKRIKAAAEARGQQNDLPLP